MDPKLVNAHTLDARSFWLKSYHKNNSGCIFCITWTFCVEVNIIHALDDSEVGEIAFVEKEIQKADVSL